jgi:hypothetical protein
MATAKRIVKWLPAKYLFSTEWGGGGGLNVYSTYRTHPFILLLYGV